MAKTNYAGLDYGTGVENRDKDTGIHYGVISMNSINLDCADFENDYGDPTCPKCGGVVKASDDDTLFINTPPAELNDDDVPDWFEGRDFTCLNCKECFYSDVCTPDEPLGWHYDADGYKLTDCLDNDIFVLASPYYTFAQFCSPCVPGTGNLDSPCDSGPKSFCLGHDWFDDDKAPYRVFRVADDVEIEAVEQVIDCDTCEGSGRRTARIWMNLGDTGFRTDDGQVLQPGDTFKCNVCDGTGKRTEVVEREVTVG